MKKAELGHEARQRRHAADDQRAGHEAEAEEGEGARDAHAHRVFGLVLDGEGLHGDRQQRGAWRADALGELDQQHEGRHRQGRADQVVKPRREHRAARMPEHRQQRARRDDRPVARHAPAVLAGEHAYGPEQQGRHAAHRERRQAEALELARRVAEHRQPDAQQRIHADLGHQHQHRRDRRRRGGVGGGQPEAERPHRALGQEGERQHRRADLQQPGVLRAEQGHAGAEVGDVERPGGGVDQRHPDQEHQRSHQVHRDVLHAGLDATQVVAVQHEPVGRRQHDLEEHEEVEQVVGQEGAVEPHQQELEERVEAHADAVPAPRREHQHGERDRRRQHQHQRGEAVGHQRDAEGRSPVGRQIHADAAGPVPAVGQHQQCDRHRPQQHAAREAEAELEPVALLVDRDHQRADDQRQQHGHDDQVVEPGQHRHSRGSSPSTWSLPESPRAPIIITR
ncbi:MAG: hypothetical protein BWZ09_00801 [Alphaproteobacteria bacterium ADurb.BinA305]|nr:MAG: hypothetical protein BWZ09_00801 [Alphaproteobacteria bacterium ADurb.BinA305]